MVHPQSGSPDVQPTADQPTGTAEGRRITELLWDPPGPSGRGPRQRLSLPEVVSAAVALADADGFEALSMRALARHLGVGAMSLYTYVPGRAELFELMIDRAYGERDLPDRALGWRARYAAHANEALGMYRRHPWLVESNLWRLPLGPHVLDIGEDMLSIGQAAGLSLALGVRVAGLMESLSFGIARGEIADQAEARRTGQSVDDFWTARSDFWTTFFEPTRFPTMVRTWETGAYEEDTATEQSLTFALDLVLDSVQRLVDHHRAVPAGTPDQSPTSRP